MSTPLISVVVATRDRPGALERCLTALSWQTATALEVVVVDDGSLQPAAVRAAVARTEEASRHPPRTRILVGARRGPAAARNLGAAAARGTIVCFTDDDCVPEPRWAQRLAAACAGGGAAAGPTVADPVAGCAAMASQLITHTLQVASLQPATRLLGFAPTCNLACHADVVRALPFDESFPLAAGEDRDWCSRLLAAGLWLRFVAEATVEHRPQLGLGGLVRQQVRYGRGAVRFRAAADEQRLSGRAFYTQLARDAARAGPRVAALVMLAQAAVAAGAAREATGR